MIKYLYIVSLVFVTAFHSVANESNKEIDPRIALFEQAREKLFNEDRFLFINYKDKPVFILAALARDEDLIEELIGYGANVNVTDSGKLTALHYIAKGEGVNMYQINSNIRLMKRLVESGADINAKGVGGTTPLLSSIENPYRREAFDFLVEKGANINVTYPWGGNLLIQAVDVENISVLGALIELGLDVNHQIENGQTALHRITDSIYDIPDESVTMIKLLALAGADLNKADNEGNTPLHYAAKKGKNLVIKKLAKLGANLKLFNKDKKRPVDLAIESDHLGTVSLLYMLN
jgi:ankyrin repeat protein